MKMRRSGWRPASSNRSMRTSVPRTVKRAVGVLEVGGRGLQRLRRQLRAPVSSVCSAPTCTAEPPVNSEREPALPKPSPRSVSPSTTRTLSIGTPNTSTTSCASVVAMPCPIALTAENTSITPSACTVDRHALLEHVAAGPFQEGGDAQAAQLAARLRLRAARASKPLQSACARRLVHHLLELADVVGLAHRVLVRHLLGPDEVAPAQRDAVDAGLARRLVHQPLDDVDRLGPAGAAVGAGGRGVGEHAP